MSQLPVPQKPESAASSIRDVPSSEEIILVAAPLRPKTSSFGLQSPAFVDTLIGVWYYIRINVMEVLKPKWNPLSL